MIVASVENFTVRPPRTARLCTLPLLSYFSVQFYSCVSLDKGVFFSVCPTDIPYVIVNIINVTCYSHGTKVRTDGDRSSSIEFGANALGAVRDGPKCPQLAFLLEV